MPKTAHVNRN